MKLGYTANCSLLQYKELFCMFLALWFYMREMGTLTYIVLITYQLLQF